jgi:hypothetical protein
VTPSVDETAAGLWPFAPEPAATNPCVVAITVWMSAFGSADPGQTLCQPAGIAVGVEGGVEGGADGVADREAAAALDDGAETPTEGAGDGRSLGVGVAEEQPPSRMMVMADARTDRRKG